MQVGIFTKIFPRPSLELVFDAVQAAGVQCVQFNMESVGQPAMPDEIPPQLAGRIRDGAAVRGLTISSVQGTFNMGHPDAAHRRDGVKRLRAMVDACETLGTSVVAICIGTRDPDNMWGHHAENGSAEAWHDMSLCVSEAVRMAEGANVVLALEPEVSNIVDSPQKARRLLDEIGSPNLKITMDAANLFHAGDLPRMAEVMDNAFALLGRDLILAHAKDLSHDGDAGHEPAGKGLLDYDRYIALLRRYEFSGPLLLHGLPEAQVDECVSFLRGKLSPAGKTAF